MTEIGLAKIGYVNPSRPPRPTAKISQIPTDLVKALKTNPTAWKYFDAMPPSHQRRYALWIMSAKREETREKRLAEAMRMLVGNQKLGLK